MICPNCEKRWCEDDEFCPQCEAEIIEKLKICAKCGILVEDEDGYCKKCWMDVSACSICGSADAFGVCGKCYTSAKFAPIYKALINAVALLKATDPAISGTKHHELIEAVSEDVFRATKTIEGILRANNALPEKQERIKDCECPF